MLAQQLLNGIVIGSVYGLFSLGFSLIFGVNRIMNMAQGAVFTWGAFTGLFVVSQFHMPFPVALLAGAIGGAAASLLVDLVAFLPLRRRGSTEFSTIVSSLGANLILVSLAQQISSTRVMRFPFDLFPVAVFTVLGLRVQLIQVVVVLLTLAIFGLLVYFIYRTDFGRQARAVAASPQTSVLLGINPAAVNTQVFIISGALAGIAGVLIGIIFNSVHFVMGEPLLLRAFVVIILGGLGSLTGALIAGFLVGIVQALGVAYLSAGVADALVFSILFVVLLVKPTGLFGSVDALARVVRR